MKTSGPALCLLLTLLSWVGAGCSPHLAIRLKTGSQVVEGITFAVEQGEIYVPLREASERLVHRFSSGEGREPRRTLPDGTGLISLKELVDEGASVQPLENGKGATVRFRGRELRLVVGAKRAEVDLGDQRLRAWQGQRQVFQCRVSSGRHGSTPRGSFRAGPYKARRHYSSLYDRAPMPWSVQVTGHVFIHGFASVPGYPASHGCIRLPLDEGNPARFFYEWIDVGTPIQVHE